MEKYSLISQRCHTCRIANYFQVHPGRQSWGPRSISDYEFIYIVQGRGEYRDDDGVRLTGRGHELLLLPPDVVHTFRCPEPDTTISCIHFSLDIRPRLPAQRFNAQQDPQVHQLFRSCAYEFDRREPYYQELIGQYLAGIWCRLGRLERTRARNREPIKMTMARLYIRDHLAEPISRTDIAVYLGVTPEHVNYLFKQHAGQTPVDYMQELRIARAKELLYRAELNVSQVAAAVGYEDPLYFSRVFKKRVGVSPRRYGQLL